MTGINGQLQVDIPSGLYSGSETATADDDNLTAEHIECGVTIFGITGTKGCYAIGDTDPAGGIVFYITPGSGGLLGMEAAPSELSFKAWGSEGVLVSGADDPSVGAGHLSTINIVSHYSSGVVIAAKSAAEFEINGIHGWYLPSIDTLHIMNTQRAVLHLVNEQYWSSTQFDADKAYYYWITGSIGTAWKRYPLRVRAVRQF